MFGAEGSPSRLPEPPLTNQRFLHFLTKLGEPLTRETNSLPGHPPARANFPLFKHFARSPNRLNFFSCIKTLDKVHSDGRLTLFHETTFFHKTRRSILESFEVLVEFNTRIDPRLGLGYTMKY